MRERENHYDEKVCVITADTKLSHRHTQSQIGQNKEGPTSGHGKEKCMGTTYDCCIRLKKPVNKLILYGAKF